MKGWNYSVWYVKVWKVIDVKSMGKEKLSRNAVIIDCTSHFDSW